MLCTYAIQVINQQPANQQPNLFNCSATTDNNHQWPNSNWPQTKVKDLSNRDQIPDHVQMWAQTWN